MSTALFSRLDAVKAAAGWEPAEVKPDSTPRLPIKLPKRYVKLLRDIRAAVGWYGEAEGGKVWLEVGSVSYTHLTLPTK